MEGPGPSHSEPLMRFRWVVEFSVEELWVADGFNLTPEVAVDMIAMRLPLANVGSDEHSEVSARVISRPTDAFIRRAQHGTPGADNADETP